MEPEVIEPAQDKPRKFVWTSKGALRENKPLSIIALVTIVAATVIVWSASYILTTGVCTLLHPWTSRINDWL